MVRSATPNSRRATVYFYGSKLTTSTRRLPAPQNCRRRLFFRAIAIRPMVTGGQVYCSPDGGNTWNAIVRDLPGVLSVEVQTLK